MKRIQSILCASLLTLAMSSAALAGNISGAPAPTVAGNISGAPAPTARGNISGAPGNISGLPISVLLGILGVIL